MSCLVTADFAICLDLKRKKGGGGGGGYSLDVIN